MSLLRQRTVTKEEEEDDKLIKETVKKFTQTLKQVDLFPKLEEEHAIKTNSGAVVSIVSAIIMSLLFFAEVFSYLRVNVTEHIAVDTRTNQKLQINFNITFPSLQCSKASLDVMDVSGDQQMHSAASVFRQRIDAEGHWLGPAYKETVDTLKLVATPRPIDHSDPHHTHDEAPVYAVNSDEPQDFRGEGCITWGKLLVNKVAGNVHIALGGNHHKSDSRHVHQFMIHDMISYNASHTINQLSFGEFFPGVVSPLDGRTNAVHLGVGHFQYFVKVVPTTYIDNSGRALDTNQYSVTEQVQAITNFNPTQMDTHKIPGVFFIYDVSPFVVKVTAQRKPFSRFITNLCAIIGGVFTVSGIVDSLLFHGDRLVGKSMRAKSAAVS